MYKLHTKCRACGYGSGQLSTLKHSTAAAGVYGKSPGLISVVDLGIQPLANDFVDKEDPRAGFAPLEVLFCPQCHLAQLSVVVDPEILYSGKYLYVTSTSKMMADHFCDLYMDILTEGKPETMVEIASNDGLLLENFNKFGVQRPLGIEPADNLVNMSRERGVETIHSFFDKQASVTASVTLGKVDLVLARHVFCHIDDWQQFMLDVLDMTNKETLVCIEIPWVVDMLNGNEFDTIYHEHLSYLNIGSIKQMLNGTPLHLHRVIHYPIHGGAIVMMIRRNDSDVPPNPSVKEYIDKEELALECWTRFNDRSQAIMNDLSFKISELISEGKTVAGLGASAKSTVWVNSCGFTKKHLKFIADSTPGKWYKTSPGSDIPIVDEGAILRDLPDYVVVFCWNFISEVLERNALARSKGVKFICPIPSLTIHE